MYWTEAWVAVLTAALAYALWRQWWLTKELQEKTEGMVKALAFKKDIRPFTPKPRARRVDTVFHDRDDEGREHWLCVNCGASVPQMGHTVKACEEYQAELIKARPRYERDSIPSAIVGHNCTVCGDDVPSEGHSRERCGEVLANLTKGSNTETV